MNVKQKLAAAAVAILTASIALPALAQQAAGTTVGHLAYRLVDLDPDDGIAPWIGVNSYTTLAHAQVYDQEGNEIAAAEIDHFGAAGFDNAYASLHADAQDDAASVRLTLHSGWGYTAANRSFRVLLSPHTQVVFSVDADLWARPEAPGVSWPTAIAELYGNLHVSEDDEGFHDSFRLEDGERHGTLSVTASSGSEWMNGYLAFDAYAVAESHALPVPEPETSVMLLGGLGLLAFVGQRRQRRSV